MATRYMTPQKERKLPATPKKAVGGVVSTPLPKSKSAGSGFPTCAGTGGSKGFGPFTQKAFP